MATKKKQPIKDTSVEEVDLSSFDIDAVDMPLPRTTPSVTTETKRPLSQKEIHAFDDNAIDTDEVTPEEDPVIKDEFDDEFEDPFDPDAEEA
jgi:hypothetical protein